MLVIWLLSGVVLLLSALALVLPVRRTEFPPARPLAVPAGLGIPVRPLAGWDMLGPPRLGSPAGECLSAGGLRENLPAAAVDSDSIRMHGIIHTGGGPLYCFLDTTSGRWFRLRPGQRDEAGGYLLTRDSADRLVLVQGETGKRHEFEEDPALPDAPSITHLQNEPEN